MSRLPFRRNRVLMPLTVIAVAAVTCPILIATFGDLTPPDFRDSRNVFRFRDGVFTAAPKLPGGVDGLKVSTNGAVWIATGSRSGLSRLDGASWTYHAATVRGGFALLGDEVWSASDEGVVRFDGQSWCTYQDALKTPLAAAIVAGTSGVWAIDNLGNLSHFDGETWGIRNLREELPAVEWGGIDDDETDSPGLAMTGDGTLWIVRYGLWRQEAGTWRQIRPEGVDLTNARLIGEDTDRVWLAGQREIAAIAADGTLAPRYRRTDLGITARVPIHRIVVGAGKTWLAVGTGLLELDGGRWRNRGCPPGTVTVTDVAAGPDGSVWVVGETRSLARVAVWLLPPLGGAAVALTIIGLLIAMWLRGAAENRLEAELALAQVAGGLPGVDPVADRAELARQARAMRWKLPLALVGFPFVAFGISTAARALEKQWPGAPAWIAYAAILAPAALAVAGIWGWRRRTRTPRPSRYWRILWRPAQGIVLLAVFMFVTAGGPLRWVDWLIPNAAVAGLVKLVVIIVLITLIFSARDIVAQVRTRAAWRAGDYDLAIRQLHGMSFGRPTARMLELEGLTHSLAGQPAEAEQCLRRALAAASQSGPPSSRRRILGCLAEVVEDLGRLEESRRLRQSAIEMGDPQGTARMGAAESLLAQGIEPQKALDLIEGAMRTTKGQVARKLAAGRWANKAWALAVLGRRKEADEAIQQSAGSAEPKLPAVAAYIHWTIGMALEAMERTTESREHFRIASEQDAKGKYGALALEQLNRANA